MAPTLIIVASIIIFPFLTYYATSSLFFRRANTKSTGKAPPTIPYFIPGLFHAVSFTQSGARKYFAELIKEYGTFAPFKVKAGPRSYVILRDPTHISRVLDALEHLTANTVKVEMFDKLFGSPRATEHLHQSEASNRNDHEVRTPEQLPFHIPDTTLASATEVYISKLSANMQNKMFQFDSWTRIEDLWSFLQLVLLRCTLDAFFGSALLKKYPSMIRDYLDFNAATEGFMHGMPRIMVSGATKPRDRLHQGMRSWLTATRAEIDETGEHNANSVEDDSAWDEKTGLRFICKHYNACKVDKVEEVNIRARAAEVLGIIHSTNTGLISSTFWMTVETLRKPHLTRDMIAIVVRHFSPITHKYDVLGLAQEPLAKSLQTEVRRLRTGTCVVRTNKSDGFPLDKQWSLPNGATVAIFSHDISLNTDVWKKIQPQALKKPLEEFWAERFMVPEQKSRSRKHVGVDTSGSATQDLGDLVTRLVACDQYPGSRFISALQMATLAVLFAEFEVQLCDTEQVDAALPPLRESAYGTVKPLEKIAVRIRKRKT